MDVSNVSESSMHKEGLKLIANLWLEIETYTAYKKEGRPSPAGRNIHYREPLREDVHQLMILSAHRLAFLEMVTKGLNYMEMHDAQAYAKFVEKKRKLEDMDFEELRVLLR